ncbi:DMT family transporter [Marispirochaeta sp.]|uniref:DMT family transporter n=1 Tax=Marispirochaeta sp. TaxID=2038653 RepID=UPI0029C67B05|nr:DMT family transporter [Marispirochaeta sp.]
MKTRVMRNDALLLMTAMIWGFAFVAQRVGMRFIGPFTYNSVRFALGAVSLLPLLYWRRKRGKQIRSAARLRLRVSLAAGAFLFIAASLQQIGIVYTTAGKAGFITTLYVVLVPLFGIAVRRGTGVAGWVGVVLAVSGLYLLSVREGFSISPGDLLVLASAVFWALHVLLIDLYGRYVDSIELSIIQFAFCSVLCTITALAFEAPSVSGILTAAVPILYGGLFSVGIAYTLQVVAQKNAPPSHAAILLSLEGAFAALGGWLLIGEVLDPRSLAGCVLMFAGMLASQWQVITGSPGIPKESRSA